MLEELIAHQAVRTLWLYPIAILGFVLRLLWCLQAVHELYEVVKGGEWGAGEDRSTRIVVIGRFLDKAAMQSSLTAACLPHL